MTRLLIPDLSGATEDIAHVHSHRQLRQLLQDSVGGRLLHHFGGIEVQNRHYDEELKMLRLVLRPNGFPKSQNLRITTSVSTLVALVSEYKHRKTEIRA